MVLVTAVLAVVYVKLYLGEDAPVQTPVPNSALDRIADRIAAAGGAAGKLGPLRALQATAAIYESRGEFTLALGNLHAALALSPAQRADASLRIDLARVHLRLGDTQQARAALEIANGVLGHGSERWEFFSELDRSPQEVWTLLGDVAKAEGQYDTARSYYDAARRGSDVSERARLDAMVCDVLQLQRKLASARRKCENALVLQPVGHPDRPMTERVLGLVYFFGGEPRRALATHSSAVRGLEQQRRHLDARWLREYVIDDEASLLEEENATAEAYAPLSARLLELIEELESGEPVWWRISDAKLRAADLYRKQGRFAEAEAAVAESLAAFQRRPAGYDKVPDYATIFELSGLLAREQGNNDRALAEFSEALRILEGCTDAKNLDVRYLQEEIADLETTVR